VGGQQTGTRAATLPGSWEKAVEKALKKPPPKKKAREK